MLTRSEKSVIHYETVDRKEEAANQLGCSVEALNRCIKSKASNDTALERRIKASGMYDSGLRGLNGFQPHGRARNSRLVGRVPWHEKREQE